MSKTKVLLLAGTSEAVEIAHFLARMTNIRAIASMAGATRAPRDLGLPLRLGGFGGATGFADFLINEAIDIVIDATHPFASRMTATAGAVCTAQGVPYLLVQRPIWVPEAGDRWYSVDTAVQVKALIPSPSRVFLGTGRQTLMDFEGMHGCEILCRVIDPPQADFPFAGGKFLVGRPPFTIEEEVSLFRKERIDWLVVKNSGGWKSRSKLSAARQLGLPVALLNRPNTPPVNLVETAAAAATWLEMEIKQWM